MKLDLPESWYEMEATKDNPLADVTAGSPPPPAGVPRRACVWLLTPAEQTLRTAALDVELLGCDPRLTEAVTLIGKARDLVADYVDRID